MNKMKLSDVLMTILFISITALSIPLGSLLANPGTFYVATAGSDITGDGSVIKPWATIGYAVSQVSDYDTIIVAAGTYYEGTVHVDKPLTIQGAGSSTIIDATGHSHGLYLDVSDITIKDLSV